MSFKSYLRSQEIEKLLKQIESSKPEGEALFRISTVIYEDAVEDIINEYMRALGNEIAFVLEDNVIEAAEDMRIVHESEELNTYVDSFDSKTEQPNKFKRVIKFIVNVPYAKYLEFGYPKKTQIIDMNNPRDQKWFDYYPELKNIATDKGGRVKVKIGEKQKSGATKYIQLASKTGTPRHFTARPALGAALVLTFQQLPKITKHLRIGKKNK